MPDLKCRMLIPQDNLIDLQRLENPQGYFNMTWNKYVLNSSEKAPTTIKCEHKTQLPMLHAYKSIYSTLESLATTGCVTSDNNQKLN